jgi:hypothetical protein
MESIRWEGQEVERKDWKKFLITIYNRRGKAKGVKIEEGSGGRG